MERSLVFFFLFFVPAFITAQLQDNFNDGDLTNGPNWQGQVDSFTVNTALELQLAANGAGTSSLHIPVEFPDSAVWELYLRMAFAPSSSNQVTIYLQADQLPLETANGYFLQIGEGGSEDAIRFFRQDGGTATELASASPSLGSDPAIARIRIIRRSGGNWTLSADYTGGSNFQVELTAQDASYGGGSGFFGLFCKYSASRSDRFFFDDIRIAPILADTSPPNAIEVKVVSATMIDLLFDEPITQSSAENVANYQISPGIGSPLSATLDPTNPLLVHLTLPQALVSLQSYEISSSGLIDLAGNSSTDTTLTFDYIEVQAAAPYDILINEIMADPTPSLALPEAEFIELFNRSTKTIQLEGFNIADRSTMVSLPSYLFLPGEYLILHEDGAADFTSYGNTLPLPSLPGLGNENDAVSLRDANNELINIVDYNSNWYLDNNKRNGGYTLELINPSTPCSQAINWIASNDPKGGTPGQANSVLSNMADNTGPKLIRAFPENANRIGIQFDKALDEMEAIDINNYQLAGISIADTEFSLAQPNVVILNLLDPLQIGQTYVLTVLTTLTDCVGNALPANNTIEIALPEKPAAMDVIINELLFDPATGGSRFVEFYNTSDKIVNLADIVLAKRDEFGALDDVSPIRFNYLLFPGEYAVVTPSPEDIQQRYEVLTPSALIESDVPTYDSREGTVVIYTIDGNDAIILDEFAYNRSFHSPFLDDREGVSLERLRFDSPTQSATNWQSAAAQVGFATPTYQNSQIVTNVPTTTELISIPNPRLSPDGDGREDFLSIFYQSVESGSVINIKIFDAEGRLIRDLAQNELLAPTGQFKWEGETDEGQKARMGIYVVWVELFSADGSVNRFKETCVLAKQLN